MLEPIFEADFLPCSFGFRPKRSAHDALQVLVDESWRGKRWVVETDIANCFSAIPHDKLMQAVEERVCDRPCLTLLRAMLRAGVMRGRAGAARGHRHPAGRGPLSPLLCNIYLHRLDRVWDDAVEHGVLVRYCDDLVVMCATRAQAEAALDAVDGRCWPNSGWNRRRPRPASCTWWRGGQGLISSAFTTGWCAGGHPGRRIWSFLARWPSRKAAQHARDRIRLITGRPRLLLPARWIVQELNWFLRGWAGYFRYGNSA